MKELGKNTSKFMLRSLSVPLTEDGDSGLGASRQVNILKEDVPEARQDKQVNIFVKAISWPSEGRGLLHVLSPLLYSNEFKIRSAIGSYFFHRDDSQVIVSRSIIDSQPDQQVVAKLDVSSNGVTIDCSSSHPDPTSCDVWEEVQRDSSGKPLSCNDFIRFGSYRVRVVDIVLSEASIRQRLEGTKMVKPFSHLEDQLETSSEHTVDVSESASASGPVCRICFEPSEENHNVLLSPCICSGSLRYIHVECLRRWLEGQLQVKQFEHGGGSYLIRAIKCEICKSVYSKSVYESILIPRPNCPHIILEDFVPSNASVSSGGQQFLPSSSKMHIVPLIKGKPIRLGRSKENDIVLGDISVSRVHATINLTDSGVRVVDLSSKFGTLVQLPQKFFHSLDDHPLRFQVGSCLIEIHVASPGRIERMLPERFLQEKGVVKLMRSKVPNERIIEAERLRRSRSMSYATPTSPAATLNNSFVRSPRSVREALLDDEDDMDHPPLELNRSS